MKRIEIDAAARHREEMQQLYNIESELRNLEQAKRDEYYRQYNQQRAEEMRSSSHSSSPGVIETILSKFGVLIFFGLFGIGGLVWVINIIVGLIQLLTR